MAIIRIDADDVNTADTYGHAVGVAEKRFGQPVLGHADDLALGRDGLPHPLLFICGNGG